ncbi:hypothetical protein AB4Z29_17895 [Paenibacillus sp. 2TAB23]|uniref:hypothetical protein n=1 Tax=Paenibacillus sp. 2TAB23 TaxID=3233004 RepID=UPI003F9EA5F6
MNKLEINTQAKDKGVPNTKRKLRRYIVLSLIVTVERKGAGRAKGAKLAEYHERAIER